MSLEAEEYDTTMLTPVATDERSERRASFIVTPATAKQEVPVDHGWAWVVLAGALFNMFILKSLQLSSGVFYVEIAHTFSSSNSMASLAYSLSAGIMFFGAPIFSALGDAFTVRAIVTLGAILICLACTICAFATSVMQIVVVYGLIVGIGQGMILVNCPVVVAPYFDRRRGLANGLLFTAAGVGSAVGPLLARFTLYVYGMPHVFMPMAAYALQMVIGAAVFRPPNYWLKRRRCGSIEDAQDVDKPKKVKSRVRLVSSSQHPDAIAMYDFRVLCTPILSIFTLAVVCTSVYQSMFCGRKCVLENVDLSDQI